MTDTPTEHAGAADLLSLTADIVVAFMANNKLDPVAVPEVISATHAALLHLTAPQVEDIPESVHEAEPRRHPQVGHGGGDRLLPRWQDI